MDARMESPFRTVTFNLKLFILAVRAASCHGACKTRPTPARGRCQCNGLNAASSQIPHVTDRTMPPARFGSEGGASARGLRVMLP